MRILGFNKKWDKLKQPEFTTFRFPRKDRDWAIGEQVQIVFHPRGKDHKNLGIAEIILKEPRAIGILGDKTNCQHITNEEAIADGFPDTEIKHGYFSMWEFLFGAYGGERLLNEPMNKLTLRWINPTLA